MEVVYDAAVCQRERHGLPAMPGIRHREPWGGRLSQLRVARPSASSGP